MLIQSVIVNNGLAPKALFKHQDNTILRVQNLQTRRLTYRRHFAIRIK